MVSVVPVAKEFGPAEAEFRKQDDGNPAAINSPERNVDGLVASHADPFIGVLEQSVALLRLPELGLAGRPIFGEELLSGFSLCRLITNPYQYLLNQLGYFQNWFHCGVTKSGIDRQRKRHEMSDRCL